MRTNVIEKIKITISTWQVLQTLTHIYPLMFCLFFTFAKNRIIFGCLRFRQVYSYNRSSYCHSLQILSFFFFSIERVFTWILKSKSLFPSWFFIYYCVAIIIYETVFLCPKWNSFKIIFFLTERAYTDIKFY